MLLIYVTGSAPQGLVGTEYPTGTGYGVYTNPFTGSVTYNETISDTLTATDSYTAAATFAPSVSDSLTGTDSLSATATFNDTLSDSLTGTDSYAASGTFNGVISDTLTGSDGIDVSGGSTADTTGGGWIHPYTIYKAEQAKKEAIELEIAQREKELETERAQAKLHAELRDSENLAREYAAKDAAIREEINRLLIEKATLIRRIDDEEATLLILLSLPFSS